MKYGKESPKKIEFLDVVHPFVMKLRFLLGGKHLTYPGFNGQFTRIIASTNYGIYADDPSNLNMGDKPDDFNSKRFTKKIVEKVEENIDEKEPK